MTRTALPAAKLFDVDEVRRALGLLLPEGGNW